MKTVVCIKRVPDTEARIRIAADGASVDESGLKYVVSPYDEFAIEAALRLKETVGEGETIALSLGAAAAGEQLRSALAMGIDRAVRLDGSSSMDGLAVARSLAAEVKELGPDLVLLGMKAVDDDQQQVGPMLAELLGLPCVTVVSELEKEGDALVCHREVEGGMEVVEVDLPAVVTVTKGPHEPRYPSLKGIMAAKKKPLEEKPADVPEPRLKVRRFTEPPARPEGRIVGEGADAVPELIRLLREEAKVL